MLHNSHLYAATAGDKVRCATRHEDATPHEHATQHDDATQHEDATQHDISVNLVSLRFHTWTYVNSSRCVHCKKNPEEQGKVKIHTGHVDGFWKVLKQTIPGSLPSKKGQARNPQIWKCMRSFQWRWECTGKNLMEATADALKKMWEKLRLPFLRLKWWKGCHSKSRRTFFFDRFGMQKLPPRREDVVILIFFARR